VQQLSHFKMKVNRLASNFCEAALNHTPVDKSLVQPVQLISRMYIYDCL
jgi:hypothetical protein